MLPRLPAFARLGLIPLVLVVCATGAGASESVRQLTVTANVQAATAFGVSSPTLVFNVVEDGDAATSALDYHASIRIGNGAEVVLSMELLVGMNEPRASDDGVCAFTVDGMGGAHLCAHERTVVARWTGGGARQGRLTVTLHGAAKGLYSVPVRLVLTTP